MPGMAGWAGRSPAVRRSGWSPPSARRALLALPLLAQLFADQAVDARRDVGGGRGDDARLVRTELRLAAGDLQHQLAADRLGELVGRAHHDQERAEAADDAILVVNVEVGDRGKTPGL